MAALGVGQGTQIAENTLFRVLPDGAGVHNDHIGALGIVYDAVAALGKVAPELFRVCFILLAAVGFHVSRGGDAFALPIGGDFITIGELCVQFGLRNDGSLGIHRDILRWIISQL